MELINYFLDRGFVFIGNQYLNKFYMKNGRLHVSFDDNNVLLYIKIDNIYLKTIDEIKRFIQEKAKA